MWSDFKGTASIMCSLGMVVALDKYQPLSTTCKSHSRKICINKNQLEVLLGRLFYIINTVPVGRSFLNRLVDLVPKTRGGLVELGVEAQKDLSWFMNMLVYYSGVSIIPGADIEFMIEDDACLSEGGGWSQ